MDGSQRAACGKLEAVVSVETYVRFGAVVRFTVLTYRCRFRFTAEIIPSDPGDMRPVLSSALV